MNEEVIKAVDVLKAGGLILYPTDTIWGIGCDATNTEAVKKVYAIKKKTRSKEFNCFSGQHYSIGTNHRRST
mgnify:CR=1 FL=1